MHLRNVIFFLAILLLSSCRSTIDLKQTPIGLINNVTFKDAEYNKPIAANGCLVSFGKNTYAVTAKHILNIAKTPKMQFVNFAGELAEWKMHPQDDSSQVILMDQLLNPNQTDSLTWGYLDRNWENYNDWIVFSVKENHSNFKPLKFRTKALTTGEKLYVVGWSYGDKTGAQRVYEFTFDKPDGDYFEIVQVTGPESLGGLSGSPVVDEYGELVGLVSSGWEDEEQGKVIIAVTSTKKMLAFLTELESKK